MDLQKFSLIHRSLDGRTISIHRLVQSVIKSQMSELQTIAVKAEVLTFWDHLIPDISDMHSADLPDFLYEIFQHLCILYPQMWSFPLLQLLRRMRY